VQRRADREAPEDVQSQRGRRLRREYTQLIISSS
jgi:hypothetical protein